MPNSEGKGVPYELSDACPHVVELLDTEFGFDFAGIAREGLSRRFIEVDEDSGGEVRWRIGGLILLDKESGEEEEDETECEAGE